MNLAFASLGSNIDARRNLDRALKMLGDRFGPLRVSSTYQSRAVGFQGDDFLNVVACFDTSETADSLWEVFREIESALGRIRGAEKFAPRTIDLDLILLGVQVIDNGRVQIPRDEITEYAFVLLPLAEIAPDLRHPTLGKTYLELSRELEVEPKDIKVIED